MISKNVLRVVFDCENEKKSYEEFKNRKLIEVMHRIEWSTRKPIGHTLDFIFWDEEKDEQLGVYDYTEWPVPKNKLTLLDDNYIYHDLGFPEIVHQNCDVAPHQTVYYKTPKGNLWIRCTCCEDKEIVPLMNWEKLREKYLPSVFWPNSRRLEVKRESTRRAAWMRYDLWTFIKTFLCKEI